METLIAATVIGACFSLAVVYGWLGLWDRWIGPWWTARFDRAEYDECEVCGVRSKHNVTLTAAKDRSGGGLVGGSSISATFCPEHLPVGGSGRPSQSLT